MDKLRVGKTEFAFMTVNMKKHSVWQTVATLGLTCQWVSCTRIRKEHAMAQHPEFSERNKQRRNMPIWLRKTLWRCEHAQTLQSWTARTTTPPLHASSQLCHHNPRPRRKWTSARRSNLRECMYRLNDHQSRSQKDTQKWYTELNCCAHDALKSICA